MKKSLIAAILAFSAISSVAYANSTNNYNQSTQVNDNITPKTRAQVRAELIEAQKSGEYARLNSEYDNSYQTFVSTKTRAQVKQELAESQRSGEYARLQAEDR